MSGHTVLNPTANAPGPEFERVGTWLPADKIGAYRGALVIPQTPDGRILFQMRDDVAGIAAPGKWGLFGGGIDPHEPPLEAAVRELEEEIGLKVSSSALTPRFSVLTGAPKWGLLYIFHLPIDLEPADICVREGGGFALATRKQAEKLDLIDYLRAVLDRFWADTPS